jgi:hypothetical protein
VQSLVALITADVHNRDVVGTLVRKGVSSASDFAWQMQLRFEFDPDADSILVRQVNARLVSDMLLRGMPRGSNLQYTGLSAPCMMQRLIKSCHQSLPCCSILAAAYSVS